MRNGSYLHTVDRFILTEYLMSLAFMLGLFFVLAFVLVLFDSLDTLLAYNASPSAGIVYVLLKLPHQIVKASPIVILLSVVTAAGRLIRNNEMLMLFVAGYSPLRLLAPLVGLLLVYVAGMFLVNELISGPASARADRIMAFQIRGGGDNLASASGLWMHGHGDRIYRVNQYHPYTQTIHGLTIFEFHSNDRTVRTRLDADLAVWNPVAGVWELSGVVAHYIEPDGGVRREMFNRHEYMIGRTPEDLARVIQLDDPEQMSHTDLSRIVRDIRNAGEDPLLYLPDLRIKEAFPFATLLLGAMAFGLMVLTGAKSQASGIGMGLLAGIGYFLSLSLGKSFALTGIIPAGLAAWAPNLICLGVAIYVFKRLSDEI